MKAVWMSAMLKARSSMLEPQSGISSVYAVHATRGNLYVVEEGYACETQETKRKSYYRTNVSNEYEYRSIFLSSRCQKKRMLSLDIKTSRTIVFRPSLSFALNIQDSRRLT